MSPSQLRKQAGNAVVDSAEDHPSLPIPGEEEITLPCVNAPQRGNETSLRVVDCAGERRDQEIEPEEVTIPYAAPIEGIEDGDEPPPPGRWWSSSGMAVGLHLAIVAALIWVVPTPSELNLGQGQMPSMQVSVVQLPPKPEVKQPPAVAPEPTPPQPEPVVEPPKPEPPKPEPPKPKPKPPEKAVPKVSHKPKPKPKPPEPDAEEAPSEPAPPSAPPPPAAPLTGQSTPGAMASPTGSQGPAGLPTGSLTDSDIKPLRMDPPVYPRMAQSRGIQGSVKVLFTITSDGRIDDIQVLESSPPRMFDNAVRQAMEKWRFEPRISGGKIVARQATKTFFFKLETRR